MTIQKHGDDSASTLTNSTISTMVIKNIIERLKNDQYRDSTMANYYAIWKQFSDFYIRLDEKPTEWEDKITLFMTYLINNNRKSSIVKSYVSALRAILRINGIRLTTESVVLTALTRACQKCNDSIWIILPIRKYLLNILLNSIKTVYRNNPLLYLEKMYRTLFCTAYYGLFRISELMHSPHTVMVTNVHIATNKDKIMFIPHTSKMHDRASKPQIIKINAIQIYEESNRKNKHNKQWSKEYLALRKRYKMSDEQFFVFQDRTPVKPQHFRSMLHKLLQMNRFEFARYNCSSFRAGRKTDLMEASIPVEIIRKLGRWKSSAMYTYLCT